MPDVVLDTHAWVWTLSDDPLLSAPARAAIAAATAVRISPITFYEIGQKVRLGKWPEMADHVTDLPAQLVAQGGYLAGMTADIALSASLLEWPHRDPFDRMIAATAMARGDVLISADTMFDTLEDARLRRVW